MLCRSKLFEINFYSQFIVLQSMIFLSYKFTGHTRRILSVKMIQEYNDASFRLLLYLCFYEAPSTFSKTKFAVTTFANLVHCIDAAFRDKLTKTITSPRYGILISLRRKRWKKNIFYFECGRLKEMHCITCQIAS